MTKRRTLKGLRADSGGLTQAQVAEKLGIQTPAYCTIEQVIDDPAIAEKLGKYFGVKINIEVVE